MYHEKHMKCSQTFTGYLISFVSLFGDVEDAFFFFFLKWIVVEFWSSESISLKPGPWLTYQTSVHFDFSFWGRVYLLFLLLLLYASPGYVSYAVD